MCNHMNFNASVRVARLEDTRQFMAEIRVECRECGTPMQFLGLEPGLDLQGARVSVDGLEANLAIAPQGTHPSPLDRIQYGIRAGSGPLDSWRRMTMWMQGNEPGPGSGLNVVVRDFGNRLDLSFVDEAGRHVTLSIAKETTAGVVASALRRLASLIDLPWPEAEALRIEGVPIEYRDGGAANRGLQWRRADGPITEHMSDFEFRRVRAGD